MVHRDSSWVATLRSTCGKDPFRPLSGTVLPRLPAPTSTRTMPSNWRAGLLCVLGGGLRRWFRGGSAKCCWPLPGSRAWSKPGCSSLILRCVGNLRCLCLRQFAGPEPWHGLRLRLSRPAVLSSNASLRHLISSVPVLWSYSHRFPHWRPLVRRPLAWSGFQTWRVPWTPMLRQHANLLLWWLPRPGTVSGGTRLPPQTAAPPTLLVPRPLFSTAYLSATWSHKMWAGQLSFGFAVHVHSLVTYSPLYSWSVFELLTITATWILPATRFWNTSSMFSARSSLTRSKYQMPVTRASKRKLPARGTGTGCFPVGGPLPRFASRTASWAAMLTSHSCPYFALCRRSAADM